MTAWLHANPGLGKGKIFVKRLRRCIDAFALSRSSGLARQHLECARFSAALDFSTLCASYHPQQFQSTASVTGQTGALQASKRKLVLLMQKQLAVGIG
jgi:hypothetical protein